MRGTLLKVVTGFVLFLPLWVRVMTRVANWYRNSGIGGQTWA